MKDVRVKQFDATKKFPIWKDIPAGDMGSEEKAMYAEEAVLSFSMPTSLWTELRVYCSKGVGNDRCDSGDGEFFFSFFFFLFFNLFFFSCAHPFYFFIFF